MNILTKLNQLQEALNAKGLDAAYISDPMTINYLTGFYSDPVERILALILFSDNEPFLFAPALEVEAIKDTGWKYPVYGYLDHEKTFNLIADHIHQMAGSPRNWGIEGESLTVDRLRALETVLPDAKFNTDLSPLIAQMRMIKNCEIK